MTEGLMLAMLIALALSLLAYKMKSLPIMFVAGLGWLVAGLRTNSGNSPDGTHDDVLIRAVLPNQERMRR